METQRPCVGDLVLVHRTQDSYGLSRVREILEDSIFFDMEELDGIPLAATFARKKLDNHCSETHGTIRDRETLERDSEIDTKDVFSKG